MGYYDDLENQIKKNIQEKKKAKRTKEFNKLKQSIIDCIDDVSKGVSNVVNGIAATIKKPYFEVRDFIEQRKIDQEKEQQYQRKCENEYWSYLSQYDQDKIGAYEVVDAVSHDTFKRIVESSSVIVHTETGPIIHTKSKQPIRIGKIVIDNFIGFVPIDDKGNYKFVDITRDRTFQIDELGVDVVQTKFCGNIRDKKGHFERFGSICGPDRKQSEEFCRHVELFEKAKNHYKENFEASEILDVSEFNLQTLKGIVDDEKSL